ncbi:MAG TPA: hypothetical protein VM263_01355 [Acidimicrobiales bacterium]|nr:hypothetical protein [Acidimicrobiales bacterium]
MADSPDLTAAIADLDDDYLRVQLLLAVRRAGNEEPRRAGLWHALAALLAAEQQKRGQSSQLTGATGATGEPGGSIQATLDSVREELRRDAAAIEAEYGDAAGEFPNPAGQAPFVQPEG